MSFPASERRAARERKSEYGKVQAAALFFVRQPDFSFKHHFLSADRMCEPEPISAEPEMTVSTLPCRFFFRRRSAVLSVSDEGASKMCHLYPDLVMASGIKTDIYKRCNRGSVLIYSDHLVVKSCQSGAGSVFCTDTGSVGAPVFYQIVFQDAVSRIGNTKDQGMVMFSKSAGCKLPVQSFCGGRRLCEYEQSFYRLVQPVYDSQIRICSSGTAGEAGLEQAYHVRCADARTLGRDSGGFMTDDDVRVFVYDE